MKIAIHQRKGSFSERWIKYCQENNINYIIVNAFDTNLVKQLKECDGFMWHHHHGIFKDALIAKEILQAIEYSGKKVFPNYRTAWHFDNKIAQKYLLESLDIPIVPTYTFYNQKKAYTWANNTEYPKVFKLKGGAGSSNVQLVKNKNQAKKIINKAFNKGFSQLNRVGQLKDKIYYYKNGNGTMKNILWGIYLLFFSSQYDRMMGRERGYVYFQDFIPENKTDTRVIIIGENAFAIKRFVRKNDFRASGSGQIIYSKDHINEECIKLAFSINEKIKAQSIAFDFIIDQGKSPLLVEISYAFSINAYDQCEGYWDKKMNWYPGPFNPQGWMVENLVNDIKSGNEITSPL